MAIEYAAKLQQIAGSRKAIATVVCIAITMALHAAGEIDASQTATAIGFSTGIFVGVIALEEGLSNVIAAWLRDLPGDDA